MCGISGIAGNNWSPEQLGLMVKLQSHRGPDSYGTFISEDHLCGLGHNRLRIIDLSDAGNQPMSNNAQNLHIVFNGEIYNYRELKKELQFDYNFKTHSDTEVILAAYEKWGKACLHKFIGMFSLAIWNSDTKELFAARDRFGVKPFYYTTYKNTLYFSSEIKALLPLQENIGFNEHTWSVYFTSGLYEHGTDTFWAGIQKLLPGYTLQWNNGSVTMDKWYDLFEQTQSTYSGLPDHEVMEQYYSLLEESIQYRLRSDVPLGINISGGLDSSFLLHLTRANIAEDTIHAFTFYSNHESYDELKWVNMMLQNKKHVHHTSLLRAADIPALASQVQYFEDEPFGGFPTLAYSNIFKEAKQSGITVLLDGQGIDEQLAGYDYYHTDISVNETGKVQGAKDSAVRPNALQRDFVSADKISFTGNYPDKLRQLQYRDIAFTKLPRTLRFNDRVSMQHSCELREPFLDHRLFELALTLKPELKYRDGQSKWMLRNLLASHLPEHITEAPKRPLQTPQREWLRNELKDWAASCIEQASSAFAGWLNKDEIQREWHNFLSGKSDNSFYIWQWINLWLMKEHYDTMVKLKQQK